MFANQRRGTVGLGSIGAVATIILATLIGTGVMVESYREGASAKLPSATRCQVVCQAHASNG